MKESVILIGILLMFGLALAIAPATSWTVGTEGKYIAGASGAVANDTTEGGNVTPLNMSINISTEKWAGYWGNISSNSKIYLSPGPSLANNVFYSWAWNTSQGGKVCATPNQAGFDWTNPSAVTTATIDSAWSFNVADSDSAANTLKSTCSNFVVNGKTVASTVGNTTGQGADFKTCALSDGGSTKNDIAFCTTIKPNGNLFNTQTGDYELLVAANETLGATETYYFWIELS